MRDKPIGNTETCCMVIVFFVGAVLFAVAAWAVLSQAGVKVVP